MLDAIALAVLSPLISQSGYRPYALIKRRKDGTRIAKAQINAELTIHPQDAAALKKNEKLVHRVETVVERRGDVEIVRGTDENNPIWEGMFSDNSPAFLLVGYGATRRVETDAATDSAARYKSRQLRYERVASLFEEHFTLRPLASWLPEWKMKNPGRYRQVITLINKLSTEAIQFTGEIEAGEYLLQSRAAKVPFSALSDGSKAYIGWVGDLLYHVCMGCPNGKRLVDNKGVVLVDEIDLHIHPEWQRTMIPTLAKALPNLQFIFTSHSP
ncbi:AAA family ATPase, partial [Rhizobium sp.]|uniref:AAA family ATPase n=1 Tax=Rhizobium sp. TaxID=391 RepID=UPI0028B2492A